MKKHFFKPKHPFDWMDFVTMATTGEEIPLRNEILGDVSIVVESDFHHDQATGIYSFTAVEAGDWSVIAKEGVKIEGYFNASNNIFYLAAIEPRVMVSSAVRATFA